MCMHEALILKMSLSIKMHHMSLSIKIHDMSLSIKIHLNLEVYIYKIMYISFTMSVQKDTRSGMIMHSTL